MMCTDVGGRDSAIVAGKPTNKGGADPLRSRWSQGRRPRGMRGSKARTGHRVGEPCHRRWSAYGKQQGKGRRKSSPALLHHISIDLLDLRRSSGLRKDAAPGVDGLIWTDDEQNLERTLADLHARIHRGAYRALPSRRTYVYPKPDGRQRPLAIAALEDKIVQRASVAVLTASFVDEFLGFWYGFRAGRGTRRTGCARCRDRELRR